MTVLENTEEYWNERSLNEIIINTIKEAAEKLVKKDADKRYNLT